MKASLSYLVAKLNGEVTVRPTARLCPRPQAAAALGITPGSTGLKSRGAPPTGAWAWPRRVMVEPVSLTLALARMAVALLENSKPVMPAMEAGL